MCKLFDRRRVAGVDSDALTPQGNLNDSVSFFPASAKFWSFIVFLLFSAGIYSLVDANRSSSEVEGSIQRSSLFSNPIDGGRESCAGGLFIVLGCLICLCLKNQTNTSTAALPIANPHI
jgi:hypothetical protein